MIKNSYYFFCFMIVLFFWVRDVVEMVGLHQVTSHIHQCISTYFVYIFSVIVCLWLSRPSRASTDSQTHTHTPGTKHRLLSVLYSASITREKAVSVCIWSEYASAQMERRYFVEASLLLPLCLSHPHCLSFDLFFHSVLSLSHTHIYSPPTTVSRIFQPSRNVAE